MSAVLSGLLRARDAGGPASPVALSGLLRARDAGGPASPVAQAGVLRALFVLALALAFSGGCAASRKAADQDPMKCERDPKCEKKRGRTADCSLQCSDDPACVERCEQVQAPNGRLGH